MTDAETDSSSTTQETSTEGDQLSRLKRYDLRLEEWLTSLREEAGQRSPEVLGALAAKAQDVADYLDKMAERAKSKNEDIVSADVSSTPTADDHPSARPQE